MINGSACQPYKNACKPYIDQLFANLNVKGNNTVNPIPAQYSSSFSNVTAENLNGLITDCENMFGQTCNNGSCVQNTISVIPPYGYIYGKFKVVRSGSIGNPNRNFGLTIMPKNILNEDNITVHNIENVSEFDNINKAGGFPGFKLPKMLNGCYDQQTVIPTIVTTVTFEDCFPKDSGSNSNCKTTPNYSNATGIAKSSLRLNYDYKIDKQGILDNELFLSIANDDNRYANSYGGYNVEILKSCPRYNGEDLYYYIGNTPPNDVNDGNVKHVKSLSQDNGKFIIENPTSSGKLYFLIADPKKTPPYGTNTHGENMGEYDISFTVNSTPTWVSDMVSVIVTPLKTLIMGVSGPNSGETGPTSGIAFDMYHSILDSGLRTFARLLMVMFITILGLGFILGIIEIKTNELLIIIFKIGVVSALLTNTSWIFFNKYLLNIFWYGADDMIVKFMGFYNSNSSYNYNASFMFLDKTVGTLLQWENFIRIFSLLAFGFINPLSWFLFTLIIDGCWNILVAAFKGIILYCVCLVINGFLIALAPIFLCFLLFKQTFRFFDTWIKQLISNMFLITFYFLAIGMINEIMFFLLHKVLNYGVYKQCILAINISPLKLCLMQFPMPFPVDAFTELNSNVNAVENGLPMSFMDVIIFYIVCRVSNIIIDICVQLAQIVSGASMAFSASRVMQHAVEAGKYTVGMDRESVDRRKRAVNGVKPKQTSIKPRDPTKAKTSAGNTPGQDGSIGGGMPGIGTSARGGAGGMPGIGTSNSSSGGSSGGSNPPPNAP